jgi:predicted Zn-dependent protease
MTSGNHGGVADLKTAELAALGSEAMEARNYPLAHRLLQEAARRDPSPNHLSLYGLALAHHTGNIQAAVARCHQALKQEPKNPELYRRLAVVYLIAGRKKEAIRILNVGLRSGRHPGISTLLQILGERKKPVLSFLPRSNPLNKYLGKIRTALKGGTRHPEF